METRPVVGFSKAVDTDLRPSRLTGVGLISVVGIDKRWHVRDILTQCWVLLIPTEGTALLLSSRHVYLCLPSHTRIA